MLNEFTINSRKLDREVTFSCRHYIFVDLNGKPGTLGKQICDGGQLSGNTISYGGDDQEKFEKICRRWYKAYIRDLIS